MTYEHLLSININNKIRYVLYCMKKKERKNMNHMEFSNNEYLALINPSTRNDL